MTITKEGRALLSGIRNSESSLSSSAYKMRYSPKGGATFNDFSKHPAIKEAVPWRTDGKTSDTAGAYQFLSSTYRPLAAKYGFQDFSPASQDKAAWYLAQENYASATKRDLQADLEAGRWADAARVLSPTWTSLPHGAEPNKKTQGFYKTVKNALNGDAAVMSTDAVNCADQLFRSACEWSADKLDKPVADAGSPVENVFDGAYGMFNRTLAGLVGLALFTIGLVKMKV